MNNANENVARLEGIEVRMQSAVGVSKAVGVVVESRRIQSGAMGGGASS